MDRWQVASAEHWAPGSSILFGEYAVTCGGRALITTLNKGVRVKTHLFTEAQCSEGPIELFLTRRLEVQISGPLGDHRWSMGSTDEGESKLLQLQQSGTLKETVTSPYEYCKSALITLSTQLQSLQSSSLPKSDQKLYLQIESETEFDLQWGLGSSAAFLVAFTASMNQLLGAKLSTQMLFQVAKNACKKVQGAGSCCDIAASLIGEPLVFFQVGSKSKSLLECGSSDPVFFQIKKDKSLSIEEQSDLLTKESIKELTLEGGSKGAFSCYYPLSQSSQQFLNSFKWSWIYMGYKTTTKEMLTKITIDSEQVYRSEEIIKKAINAMKNRDVSKFYNAFIAGNDLLNELGCLDLKMLSYLKALEGEERNSLPIKVSGSGHGDCFIAINLAGRAQAAIELAGVKGMRLLEAIAIGSKPMSQKNKDYRLGAGHE